MGTWGIPEFDEQLFFGIHGHLGMILLALVHLDLMDFFVVQNQGFLLQLYKNIFIETRVVDRVLYAIALVLIFGYVALMTKVHPNPGQSQWPGHNRQNYARE